MLKDAEYMYEWMSDSQISQFFRFDVSNISVESCAEFIKHSGDDENTMHFAIANHNDDYLGTISLKNITKTEAEYAISTRKKVHGTGVAMQATKLILDYAFNCLNLERVYLNVLVENKRANSFYKKAGFHFWYQAKNAINIRGNLKDLNWYYYNKPTD